MVYCDCKYFATKKKRRHEDEVVEKSACRGDCGGALRGKRWRDRLAGRAGICGNDADSECGRRYLWKFVLWCNQCR